MKAPKKGEVALWLGGGLSVFLLLAPVLGQYAWYPQEFNTLATFNRGTFLGLILGGVILVAYGGAKLMKASSPRISTQNRDFTFNPTDEISVSGPFNLIKLGGLLSHGISVAGGGDGVLMVPRPAYRGFSWKTHLALGAVRELKFGEIPREQREDIEQKGLEGPYYILGAPEHVELRGGDYLAELREFFAATHSEYDRAVAYQESNEQLKRIARDAQRRGPVQKMVEAVRKSNGSSRDDD